MTTILSTFAALEGLDNGPRNGNFLVVEKSNQEIQKVIIVKNVTKIKKSKVKKLLARSLPTLGEERMATRLPNLQHQNKESFKSKEG